MGNASQNRAVGLAGWIRHGVTFSGIPGCDFMLKKCTLPATAIIRQTGE
jgi:hypothetical protein